MAAGAGTGGGSAGRTNNIQYKLVLDANRAPLN